jgi:hypothetical protein
MGFFKKSSDPISDRSRALNAEIAALEAKIKKLDARVQHVKAQPRLRSTALPHTAPAPPVQPRTNPREPIFEPVEPADAGAAADAGSSPAHYNDLGVRKYDLAAVWRRLQNHLRGPTTHNPKLVSYLAAGSIKGLRPLRYEKRVARNRFVVLFILLLLVLYGIVAVFYRR